MSTRKTLTTIVLVLGIAATLGWAASVNLQDTGAHSDHKQSKAIDDSLIFADGFESGDTSEWNYQGDGSCTISTVDLLPLPTPSK